MYAVEILFIFFSHSGSPFLGEKTSPKTLLFPSHYYFIVCLVVLDVPVIGSTSTSLSSATPMVLTTPTKPAATTDYATTPASPDNSFLGFCELCGRLEKEPSYNAKTKLIYTYLKYGNSGGQQLNYSTFSHVFYSMHGDTQRS